MEIRITAHAGYMLDISSSQFGFDGIKKIKESDKFKEFEERREENDSDTNHSYSINQRVVGWTIKFGTGIDIKLPDDVARRSGLFNIHDAVKILIMDENFLNDYIYEKVVVEDAWGKSPTFSLELRIDKEKIIDDWSSAGYPIAWKS